MAVHKCVYPSFEKVILIYPQIKQHGFSAEVQSLLEILYGRVQLDGYNPFISPLTIQTSMDDGKRELLRNLFEAQYLQKLPLFEEINVRSKNAFTTLFHQFVPDLELEVEDFWVKQFLLFKDLNDISKINREVKLLDVCEQKVFTDVRSFEMKQILDASTDASHVEMFEKCIKASENPIMIETNDPEEFVDLYRYLKD